MSDVIQARMEIGYLDSREARINVPAQVTFEPAGMALVITDIDGTASYSGERRGQGHYLLSAPELGADATLHRFNDSLILEGFWCAHGDRGFWRLHLPDQTRIPDLGKKARSRGKSPVAEKAKSSARPASKAAKAPKRKAAVVKRKAAMATKKPVKRAPPRKPALQKKKTT